MKLILGIFVVLFVLLQYQLWVQRGSIGNVVTLKKELAVQVEENVRLKQRNQALFAEVDSLKKDHRTIEAYARHDLGMVKEGETYYQIVK